MKRIIIDFRCIPPHLKSKSVLMLIKPLQLTSEDIFLLLKNITRRTQIILLPLRINTLNFSELDEFINIGGEIEIKIINPK